MKNKEPFLDQYRSWIEIDLNQFRKNIRLIKAYLGSKKYCLPIKGNAYGHGLVAIAKAAAEEKVDYLAVATLSEGKKLRSSGIHLPILVLGSFQKEEIKDLIDCDLEFTISSQYKAELVEEYLLKRNQKAKVHLKIDTGMRRVGAIPKTAFEIYKSLMSSSKIELKGIYSHYANADIPSHPFNLSQKEAFTQFLNKVDSKHLYCHIANSSAFLDSNLNVGNMIRVGMLAFGMTHLKRPEALEEIKSFFSLKSRVSYFKVIQEGEGVSYGHTYIAKKKTRIITLPLGYGDGYLRGLSNKSHVLVRGQKYPVVGTICMDQMMVDIGDGEAYVGDEVVLIGKQNEQEITLEEIADLAHTIPYEILCHFNERLPRVYLKSSAFSLN